MWSAIRTFAVRLSATSRSRPIALHPKLAAAQPISDGDSRAKKKYLRRKETRLKRQITRDVNNLKQLELRHADFKVDPVLGDTSCAFIQRIRQQSENSDDYLGFGYDRLEFEKLTYGAELAAIDLLRGHTVLRLALLESEQRKKKALETILSLRNTDKRTKRSIAISLACAEFQRFDGDTGLPEVQAAVATVKIHFAMQHIRDNKKDKQIRALVRQTVQHRQRILKYLKRDKPERYYYTIAKLGLTDDVITREFNMGMAYFERYMVWGDKKLVKLSDKQQKKADAMTDLKKKVENYHAVAKTNFEKINELALKKADMTL